MILNKRGRFGVVAGGVSAAILIATMGALSAAIVQMELSHVMTAGIIAPVLISSVILWRGLSAIVEGMLRSSRSVRNMLLGECNVDGIWLQTEAGSENFISIISATTSDKGLEWIGYRMNANKQVVAHVAFELANNNWPNMEFKFADGISDEGDPWRLGYGEIQFERGFKRVNRFTGIMRSGDGEQKRLLNGQRITRSRELRKLQTLTGRVEVLETYWALCFPEDNLEDSQTEGGKDVKPPFQRTEQNFGTGTLDAIKSIQAPPIPSSTQAVFSDTPTNGAKGTNEHSTPSGLQGTKIVEPNGEGVTSAGHIVAEDVPAGDGASDDEKLTSPNNRTNSSYSVSNAQSETPEKEMWRAGEKSRDDQDAPSTETNKNIQISEIESRLRRARAAAEEIAENTLRNRSADVEEAAQAPETGNEDPDGLLSKMRSKQRRRRRNAG